MAIYTKDGALLFVSGAAATHADCCDVCNAEYEECPASSSSSSESQSLSSSSSQSSCACPSVLTADVKIKDYTDGDLTSCAGCSNDVSAPWDGIWNYTPTCSWIIDYGGTYGSIGGKLLGTTSEITYDTTLCKWTMKIYCLNGDNILIWSGEKGSGDDPMGVYTRTGGCDGTATLEIVLASSSSSSNSQSLSSSSSSSSSSCSSSSSSNSNNCGTDPQILVSVSGASGTVNWIGGTWVLPGDSGVKKSLCPFPWVQGYAYNSSYAQSMWQELWFFSDSYGRLKLLRAASGTGTANTAVNVVSASAVSPVGGAAFSDKVWPGGATNSSNMNTPPNVRAVSQGTSSNYAITDAWNGSFTIGAITYSWERGLNW